MKIRNPVDTPLSYRPELTFEEHTMLIEWAVRQKYGGEIHARGTDPEYAGCTYWLLAAGVRITLWPTAQRVWATHDRALDPDSERIIRFLQQVLATHPPTRHE